MHRRQHPIDGVFPRTTRRWLRHAGPMGMDASADRHRREGVIPARYGRWMAMALLLGSFGCSSSTSPGATKAPSATPATKASPSSPRPTAIGTYPPSPAGGTDCGINSEMSGWPTTTASGITTYACIYDALASGRSARLVVIRPSNVDSGRRTNDGYSIPAGIFLTYRVLGPRQIEVTNDRRQAGGPITTQDCTGLAQPVPGQPPTPSGCSG